MVPHTHGGSTALSGRLSESYGDTLLVLVHGLGGSSQSAYLQTATLAAHARGISVLRLNLRGADRRGDDLFHAGLSSDLEHVLSSPQLRRFNRVLLLGYSLGGHVCLHYACGSPNSVVQRVAAICSPLDLSASATAFDAPWYNVYRRHVLGALSEMYAAVASKGRSLPLSLGEARRITHIRDWDERIVAPYHGFKSAEEYYTTQSVSRILTNPKVSCLYVYASRDPLVPPVAVRPALAAKTTALEVYESSSGGHIGFPRSASLELAGTASMTARGLDNQVVAWLDGS